MANTHAILSRISTFITPSVPHNAQAGLLTVALNAPAPLVHHQAQASPPSQQYPTQNEELPPFKEESLDTRSTTGEESTGGPSMDFSWLEQPLADTPTSPSPTPEPQDRNSDIDWDDYCD